MGGRRADEVEPVVNWFNFMRDNGCKRFELVSDSSRGGVYLWGYKYGDAIPFMVRRVYHVKNYFSEADGPGRLAFRFRQIHRRLKELQHGDQK